MGTLITLGLSEIQVGTVDPLGDMPVSMAKIGKTYQDSCKLSQAAAEVTEHYEEGSATPTVKNKKKKVPVLVFSMMDPDVDALTAYIGGAKDGDGKWGYNGDEVVTDKAIRIKSKQGLWVDIPKGDIEAVIDSEFSEKGLFKVNFTVTPLAVPTGKKAIMAYPAPGALTVDPTTLSFTAAEDSTGDTITATSTGNLTYAGKPTEADWLYVTRTGKVATVKVSANTNSESRTALVTLVADGKTSTVTVTQAGA